MTNDELLAIAGSLLSSVRNYLDITWLDPTGDEKLTGIIARGILYMNRLAGEELTYIEGDAVQQGKHIELLLDYCRYVRDNALEDFERNYLPELTAFQLDHIAGRVVLDE